ncbi:hypothetical protein [Streptomyces kasugaensis]|uniref:hypothetical protein n=1 Tax=Streptomyces kasugaensis TaxID=1946 RepID=UPI001F5E7B54|nr:hypothetical protein [Streptomyces kasugaensis]
MNTPQATARLLRADRAIHGARTARKFLARRAVIARQLDAIAPGTFHVRTVPVWTDRDGERRLATWVALTDALGLPIQASREAHRAARGLLRRAFPGADWTRALAYDTATGALDLDEPTMPEELHR